MTNEECVAAVSAIREEIAALVASLTARVEAVEASNRRLVDMVQELSESHDQNRRELQAATARGQQAADQMEQHVLHAEILRSEIAAEKQALVGKK